MAVPVTWDANYDYPPAFAGMIADDMFTDKVTVPCGATAQPFGTLVATVTGTGVSVIPISTNPIEGIALHDPRLAGRVASPVQDGYVQYDAMSVMRRGRVWAKASGTCTVNAVAKYDPATGIFADAGSATLAQAKFLSANLTIPNVDTGSQIIVLVELHSPFVA